MIENKKQFEVTVGLLKKFSGSAVETATKNFRSKLEKKLIFDNIAYQINTFLADLSHYIFHDEDNDPRITEINGFINSLSESEFGYVRNCMRIAADIVAFIHDFNISKEEFCAELKIDEKEYKTFIDGGYNYDLRKIAALEAFKYKKILQRKSDEAEKEAKVIEVAKDKHSAPAPQ